MPKSWIVRADRKRRLFDAFKEIFVVAIGLNALCDLSGTTTVGALAKVYFRSNSQSMAIGQFHRFFNEMSISHHVALAYSFTQMANMSHFEPVLETGDHQLHATATTDHQTYLAQDLMTAGASPRDK
ncbi:hypothetical protein HFO99_19495 [Rhizobium leguminosarum]|uniref:hypothetical protein n=1 Tax=Rhizobium leguminosarum TaxID=384 RepID=UPI001C983DFF|nr:hypothetical protein [Rhizobium leguminosarum]MBY5336093.1 hypothetical protein [Rhizobium leguminosarum]